MKKIIYRVKATGKISHDGNYEDCLRAFHNEELIAEKINTYNKEGRILRAEIVELDDVAEFYAKRAESYLGVPNDISKRLRDIASDIDDIATEIEAVARK